MCGVLSWEYAVSDSDYEISSLTAPFVFLNFSLNIEGLFGGLVSQCEGCPKMIQYYRSKYLHIFGYVAVPVGAGAVFTFDR